MDFTKLCILLLCCAAFASALRIESQRLRGKYIGVSDDGEIIMSNSGLSLYIKRRGLLKMPGAVSLRDRATGKYVRHNNGKVYLDGPDTTRDPEAFEDEATFLDADIGPFTFRFQSSNGQEHFIRVDGTEVKFDATKASDEEGAYIYNAHLKEDSTFKIALA